MKPMMSQNITLSWRRSAVDRDEPTSIEMPLIDNLENWLGSPADIASARNAAIACSNCRRWPTEATPSSFGCVFRRPTGKNSSAYVILAECCLVSFET